MRWFTAKQTAEELGISTDTLYAHAHAGRIAFRWKNKAGRGGKMLFAPADLQAFLDATTVRAKGAKPRQAYVPRNF